MLSQSQIRAAWAPRCRGPWITYNLNGKGRATVRPAIHEAVRGLDACLKAYRYTTRYEDTGAYVCRPSVGGGGYSTHAYGIAIDINWQSNPYQSRLRTDMPSGMTRAICNIRTKNGKQVWNWGGYWSGTKDAMHFEIVCSPQDLATGINWATVPGSVTAPPQPAPPSVPGIPPSSLPPTNPTQEQEMETPLIIQHTSGAARYRDPWGKLWNLNPYGFTLLRDFFKVKHVVADQEAWNFWHSISQNGNALPK